MPQENKKPQLPTTSDQLFNEALALQQQKKWDESLSAYQNFLKQGSDKLSVLQASAVYYNMSALAYDKGDFLKAYIWSKKALALNPDNQTARDSFELYSKKFEPPLMPRHISNYDNFKSVISKVSLDGWVVLAIILVFTTLWLMLKNFLTAKKNQLASDFSKISKWPSYLLLLITLSVILTAYFRYSDLSTPKGIITAEKAAIQSAPGENKPVIFEAQAGLELEVLKSDQGFYQVRYPGAFSGWVSRSDLEILGLIFEQNE